MDNIKWYMNNPCRVLREVTDNFSEIEVFQNFADDIDARNWCFGCQCSGDGAYPTHTCEQYQAVIDYINEKPVSMFVIVENRLLADNPVEMATYDKIKVENKRLLGVVRNLKLEIEKFKEQELQVAKSIAALLKIEADTKERVSALEREEEEIFERVDTVISKSSVTVKSGVFKTEIDGERYKELLIDSHTLCALENGGVDNWEWYGEAISNYGDIERMVNDELTN